MGQLEQLQEEVSTIKNLLFQVLEKLPEPESREIKVSIPQAAEIANVHEKTMSSWVKKGKVNSVWNKNKSRKLVIVDELMRS